MSTETNPTMPLAIPLEPERYELSEDPLYHFALGRREFFKALGGLVVVLTLAEDPAMAQRGESGGSRRFGPAPPREIGAWLHIAEDGAVTAYTGKVEVGQDSRTSLTQAVAGELRVPVDSVQMVMGDTDLTPFDMGTFGSRTTPTMAPQLRKVAAAARELLLQQAADQWKTDRAGLVAEDGKITDPHTNRSISYGELTRGQKLLKSVDENEPTTPATDWKVAGTSVPRRGARETVTGSHHYPSDMAVPGMLHGKVVRPAGFNATLKSVDTRAAEAMPGVVVVHDGAFVAVAAPDLPTAERAAAAIKADWDVPAQPSSRDLFEYLKTHPEETPARDGAQPASDVDDALANAHTRLKQTYTIAYIAHVPLEPRAALAQWDGGKLTVWTGTQRPFGVREELMAAFHLPEDRVRVIMPDTGSGYGGKHTGEAAVEAARLARAAGKPVKLNWTREEEFTWAYFRPAGVIDISSGAAAGGALTAWDFHNYNSGGAGIQTPYDVPHKRIEFHPTRYPLRQGSYRALAATANHFARETHMDELAGAVGMDPLAFRLKNLKDDRVRAVLQAATDRFGWSAQKPAPGTGIGLACGTEKGGYVATCAQVAAAPGGPVRVQRLVTAFECGAIVNPDNLNNQVEGAAIMGIGGALFEAIQFADGKILNPHLSQYRVPRFRDVPAIEVVLIDRKDLPSAGAGESPIVCVAPAIGNALYRATGRRSRSMPLTV